MCFSSDSLHRAWAPLFLGTTLLAQGVQTGGLQGVVRAPSGTPIPGARVRLDAGRGARIVTTDPEGRYHFVQLLVGDVRLQVSSPGLETTSAAARVHLGETGTLDFTLREPGAVVEVVAARDRMDPAEFADGKNTSLQEVDRLPVNDRSLEGILRLAPGTASDANGLTVRGGPSVMNLYLVDGVDVLDPVGGGPGVYLNEDMIEEVQLVSGAATADLGRFTGGMVNAVTKSGTNTWEGLARLEWTNPGVDALAPMQARPPMSNGIQQNFRVSGPLVVDHLFVVAGYRTTSPHLSRSSTTTAPADWGGNIPFNSTVFDERKDLKLDWVINGDHRLSFQVNETTRDLTNLDYPSQYVGGSTSLDTLSSRHENLTYRSFGYVGTLGSSLTANLRYGTKEQNINLGGNGSPDAPTFVDANTQYQYSNGWFAHDVQRRPVENATASLTWSASALGEHEFKVGGDWFRSSVTAPNGQTPSELFFVFDGFTSGRGVPPGAGNASFANMVFDPYSFVEQWIPGKDQTIHNTVTSWYVNDRWKLDRHWAFNLGLRYDGFVFVDDRGATPLKTSNLSPRLAAVLDPQGDGRWTLEAAYDIYAGQVLIGSLSNYTSVLNPALYIFPYAGGPGNLLSSYNTATPIYVLDPNLNHHSFVVDPNLKLPQVKEASFTLRHADGRGGRYSLTVVRRDWSDFASAFGSEQPNPQNPFDLLLTTLRNDPSLVRRYQGLELQAEKTFSAFDVGGNLTWSRTLGNFEGGESGNRGTSQSLGPLGAYGNPPAPAPGQLPAYPYQPTQAQMDPYGRLAADVPLSVKAWATWGAAFLGGRASLGLLGTFASGAPYSQKALASLSGGGGYPANLPGLYGPAYTRYFGSRGANTFPQTYVVNFQASYERTLAGSLTGFSRLNVTNVFNHQEETSFNIVGNAVIPDPAAPGTFIPDRFNSPEALFLPGPSYGKPVTSANFLPARALNLAVGIRF